MTDHPKPRPPHTGCPTCGHPTNHDGHPVTQIACDTAAFERDRATDWLILDRLAWEGVESLRETPQYQAEFIRLMPAAS